MPQDFATPTGLNLASDQTHAIDYVRARGVPDSVTVAQQILVLFVQVRILVGQLDKSNNRNDLRRLTTGGRHAILNGATQVLL